MVLAQKKRKILYKNGRTLPASAQVLMAEAKRDIDHSAKLGRNMRVANPGMKRPSESDAHHIVSAQCREAEKSRQFIFKLGIGINDFDNGVILPRFKSAKIPSMPNAIPHQHIHTIKYHMSVFFELFSKEEHTEPMARMTLQAIGGELVVGTFPYI
ncbi:MAG: AHH domain-containing protein [Burkholderiales bacterium]|nr:AHH domain-containing protein [Burkholderiales bacterium]